MFVPSSLSQEHAGCGGSDARVATAVRGSPGRGLVPEFPSSMCDCIVKAPVNLLQTPYNTPIGNVCMIGKIVGSAP